MQSILTLFFLMFTISYSLKTNAEENAGPTVVAVGEANLDKDKMIIQDPYSQNNLSEAQKRAVLEMTKLLRNDFSFYQKKFYLVEALPNNTLVRPATNFDYWAQKNVHYLVTVAAEKEKGDQIKLTVILDDIKAKKQRSMQTKMSSIATIRKIGHEISDAFYRDIVGKESIFKSKIIFVSDRNSRSPRVVKEVYMMDYDGKNVVQLTSQGGIAISPSMSLDGKSLVYSMISSGEIRKRNHNLYLQDIKSHETKIISQKEGINSGAIFMPTGKSIALTLTMSGNAEIYEMNLENKELRKITNHFASDVDPSVTPDGSLMTFLSDRAGKAMIYTLDPRGEEKEVKRISYVGQFNATPRFSPDGKEIVFSSWLENSFDLFRISSTGDNLVRLTKNFGSNEDPTYSNDGEFIAFTSQRIISRVKAEQNIYIMDRDGDILGAITAGFGNCTSPRWYNF